jgi:hypothetical protein
MGEPTETTDSDTKDGFVVLNVGNMNNNSEFDFDAFGSVRCTITAFVPQRTKGRLNKTLYKAFETSINEVVNNAIHNETSQAYYISGDDVLSIDTVETTQQGNQYHVYIKSFLVIMDGELEQ